MSIKAGVIIKSRFISNTSKYSQNKGYKGFIDYMDRLDATTYDKFTNYMSNNEKSDGLFLMHTNNPSAAEIASVKQLFSHAQAQGSLLEQLVISFDMDYLKEYNIIQNDIINGDALKDYTRLAIEELKRKEGNMDHFEWAGAVHYNTEHVHIHVGMVDTQPSWTPGQGRCFLYRGKVTQRGKFKLSSLNRAKSVYVNQIIDAQEKNKKINNIMHEQLIKTDKSNLNFLKLRRYNKLMSNLIEQLPANKSLWKYNMNALHEIRPKIDEIIDFVLENECADEFKDFVDLVDELDQSYARSYGKEEFTQGSFREHKVQALYAKIGNKILKEALTIDTFNKKRFNEKVTHNNNGKNIGALMIDSYFSYKRMKKITRKSISSMKNQAIYRRNQEEQENVKGRQ